MNKKYKYIDEIPCCFCTFVKPKFAWFEKFFNLREKKHHECHFICSRCYDKYYQELGFYSKKCIKEASIDNITGKEDKPPYWIPCDEKQWERLKKVIVSIEEKNEPRSIKHTF